MKIHFDDILGWVKENWFPLLTLTPILVGIVLSVPTTIRTSKNVEAIAKCLIKAQVLDPNEVQLSQTQFNIEIYEAHL